MEVTISIACLLKKENWTFSLKIRLMGLHLSFTICVHTSRKGLRPIFQYQLIKRGLMGEGCGHLAQSKKEIMTAS